MLVTTCSVVVFGWVLHYRQVGVSHIFSTARKLRQLSTLLFQFIAALCMQFDFSVSLPQLWDLSEQLQDLQHPPCRQESSNTSSCSGFNTICCALAAIVASFLQDMVDAMGIGWTFAFISGLCLVALGLFFVDYHGGTSWRQRSIASSSLQRYRSGTA